MPVIDLGTFFHSIAHKGHHLPENSPWSFKKRELFAILLNIYTHRSINPSSFFFKWKETETNCSTIYFWSGSRLLNLWFFIHAYGWQMDYRNLKKKTQFVVKWQLFCVLQCIGRVLSSTPFFDPNTMRVRLLKLGTFIYFLSTETCY